MAQEEWVCAIYSNDAQSERELSFVVGDLIKVTSKSDDWWGGEHTDGSSGYFPANYVEPYYYGEESQGNTPACASPVIVKELPPPVDLAPPLAIPSRQVQAIWDFAPESTSNELPFSAGDIITVIREVDESWLEGSIDDVIGMFPRNYVKDYFASIPDPTIIEAKSGFSKSDKKAEKTEKSKEEKDKKLKEKEEKERKDKEKKEKERLAKEEKDKLEKEEKDKKEKEKREKERQKKEWKEKEQLFEQEQKRVKEEEKLKKEADKKAEMEQKEAAKKAELDRQIREREEEIARMRDQQKKDHEKWVETEAKLLAMANKRSSVFGLNSSTDGVGSPAMTSSPVIVGSPDISSPAVSSPATRQRSKSAAGQSARPLFAEQSEPSELPSAPVEVPQRKGPRPPPGRPKSAYMKPPPPPPGRAQSMFISGSSLASQLAAMEFAERQAELAAAAIPPPLPLSPQIDDFKTAESELVLAPPPPPIAHPVEIEENKPPTPIVKPKVPPPVAPKPRKSIPPTPPTKSTPPLPLLPFMSSSVHQPIASVSLPSTPIMTSSSLATSIDSPVLTSSSLPASPQIIEAWRFKVYLPGKERPVWVTCEPTATVEKLRSLCATKAGLPDTGIVLIFDDAELDITDIVNAVLEKNDPIRVETV